MVELVVEYEASGRVLAATVESGPTKWFIRDHLGDVIAVTSATDSVVTLVEGLDVRYGSPTFYSSALGMRVASRVPAGSHKYYVHDHLGSVRVRLNASFVAEGSIRYRPFGDVLISSGSWVAVPYGYEGVTEEANGLLDFNARHYQAERGVFLQPDTVVLEYGNPQSLNRYALELNSPLSYTDPSGHAPIPYSTLATAVKARQAMMDMGMHYWRVGMALSFMPGDFSAASVTASQDPGPWCFWIGFSGLARLAGKGGGGEAGLMFTTDTGFYPTLYTSTKAGVAIAGKEHSGLNLGLTMAFSRGDPKKPAVNIEAGAGRGHRLSAGLVASTDGGINGGTITYGLGVGKSIYSTSTTVESFQYWNGPNQTHTFDLGPVMTQPYGRDFIGKL